MLKVAETLLDGYLPENVMIVLLKCLGNSAVTGYMELEIELDNTENASAHKNIYKLLFKELEKCTDYLKNKNYPFQNFFPYEGVLRWVVKTITEYSSDKPLLEEQNEIVRLCLQFLCNFFTYSFDTATTENPNVIIECIKDEKFNNAIM